MAHLTDPHDFKGTELGRVRGLGSRHHGAGEWLLMRYTSVAVLVTSVFLLVSLLLLPDFSFATVRSWMSGVVPAVAMALLVISLLWHTKLGVAELIGDYVHEHANKFAAILALNLVTFGAAAFGLFCLARLAFGQEAG
ncbi:MAG: succinate dehydrogenase, hydrophobic membrane anchor protein [Tsuneonella sp.]